MYDEDGRKIVVPDGLVPLRLEKLSVEAMQQYIQELEAEMIRVKEEITKRGDLKQAAESFFKS